MRLFYMLALMCLSIFITHPTFSDDQDQNKTAHMALDSSGYLASPYISVLAYHNHYPVGKQGGIEVIHHDERVITNASLDFKLKVKKSDTARGFFHEPIPKVHIPNRVIKKENQEIYIPFEYSAIPMHYAISIMPEDQGFVLKIDFKEPVDLDKFEEIVFDFELYPGAFKGKTFMTENDMGTFPYDFTGPVLIENGDKIPQPMARGRKLVLSPEDPMTNMKITSDAGEMTLYDGRIYGGHQWFVVSVKVDDGAKENGVSIHFEPNIVSEWIRQPMIAHSQVGYHTDQSKKAIIEIAQNDSRRIEASLIKLTEEGPETVMKKMPESWGKYMRYNYLVFDFSGIEEAGMYQIQYGDQLSNPIKISNDIFEKGVWQPALETFLPVQMCHMRVKDGGKLWHGVCHLDDGLQVPAPLPFFDGFKQNEKLESPFEPHTTIPGLNVGGWHDAGDDDVNTGSSGRTTYHLALMIEEFGVNTDQTTVDFEKREVHLHQPDGIPDAVQQLDHGMQWLLAQYRVMDHSVVGVISNSWETYTQAGQWGHMTDNLFYKEGWPEDSTNGIYSGRFDDRYVFTNKDTRREFEVACFLAASSRAMRPYNEALAQEALEVAQRIWKNERDAEPVFFANVGTANNLTEQRTNAAVELYLATHDDQYIRDIENNCDSIFSHFSKVAWTLSRVDGSFNDESFKTRYADALDSYSDQLAAKLDENPFGVFLDARVWGFNWDILWQIYPHYYLIKNKPEQFPIDPLLDAINFTLGCHPGNNYSHVSGVGNHQPIPAFGLNRTDNAYIPGGVFSGVEVIEPDFFELKPDHPYLWQQSEYIVFGATPYIFCVLAADAMLNKKDH